MMRRYFYVSLETDVGIIGCGDATNHFSSRCGGHVEGSDAVRSRGGPAHATTPQRERWFSRRSQNKKGAPRKSL